MVVYLNGTSYAEEKIEIPNNITDKDELIDYVNAHNEGVVDTYYSITDEYGIPIHFYD